MKLCWLGIHKFEQWKEVERGIIKHRSRYISDEWGVVGSYITQERICKICGKKFLNTQKTYEAL